MASSSSSCSSCHGCLVLLLLLLVAVGAASGAGAAVADAGSSSLLVQLNMESMLSPASSTSCPTPQEQKHGATMGTRMPIVPRHGPCSPLAGAHGKAPTHEEILTEDQHRVESIRRRVHETTGRGRGRRKRRPSISPVSEWDQSYSAWSSTHLPATSGIAFDTGNYVVTVGLGTPAQQQTVVFDTGSDTTWVQCEPCAVSCYQQEQPIFSPTKSSTYANISCASSYCSDLYISGCSGGSTCLYAIQYGDGSSTVGFYAQDTLTLGYDKLKGFRFGCGEKNTGLFGETAGLMGLGRGESSLTVQAYDRYRGAFAYCLPATSSGTTGFLDLGPGVPAAANARLTPMLVDEGPTFYYVGMTGIKVGGRLLPVPASVFSTAAGTIVDSGTVITRLPPSAYEPLRSAFAGGMAALGYPKAPAFSILDTCYNLSGVAQQGGGSVALPAVALVFRGRACLDVDASGILYVPDLSQACLAFAANEDDTDVAIIGNTQQKTYSMLYDLRHSVVGFAPGAC